MGTLGVATEIAFPKIMIGFVVHLFKTSEVGSDHNGEWPPLSVGRHLDQ